MTPDGKTKAGRDDLGQREGGAGTDSWWEDYGRRPSLALPAIPPGVGTARPGRSPDEKAWRRDANFWKQIVYWLAHQDKGEARFK